MTPNHYKINDLDTMSIIIEIVKNNNLDTEESIYLFNTLKYLVRFGNKDGVNDLEKAKDYLNRLIDKICGWWRMKWNIKEKYHTDLKDFEIIEVEEWKNQ